MQIVLTFLLALALPQAPSPQSFATISGKVVDAEGRPLVGFNGVSLMRYSYGTDGKRALLYVPGLTYPGLGGSRQRTNDLGEFRFYDVPPGEYYLGISGGGAVGSHTTYFFPGGVDESKATPLRVVSGEDRRLGTLTLPPRQKGVEVTLLLSGAGESSIREIHFGDIAMMMATANPNELTIAVMPGHYEAVVSNGTTGTTGLRYATLSLDVASSPIERAVVLQPGVTVTGKVLIENAAGQRETAPRTLFCSLRSKRGSTANCVNSIGVPGHYELHISGLPQDAYVFSATSGGKDFLIDGFDIAGNVDVEVVVATLGGIVQGTVQTAEGKTLPKATVALVPDAPYRNVGLRYRSVVTDADGRFEVRGIAPGAYKLFAWPELDGAAYRNAEFMKTYEERGKQMKIEKGSRETVNLTAF